MSDDVSVYVGVGSNIQPARHVRLALDALRETFGALRVSPVYQCPPVGFDGADFYNLVVAFHTDRDVRAVDAALDAIELAGGRDRSAPRFAPRTLDLDLLLYGDCVMDEPGLHLPRDEILRYPFVLKPLAELAGELRHPVTGRSMAEHWRDFAGDAESLTLVSLPEE
jgi:2-amino-4-hydroxy-6-hydroxymethyldihydropteridine diphosphokinase